MLNEPENLDLNYHKNTNTYGITDELNSDDQMKMKLRIKPKLSYNKPNHNVNKQR